ncbi:molybdopterin-guanine dinucleotide biosynthesis protein B [uncultured Cohaesibacter sp.]|uniref:molybdopterin-guanine dinucleotide biosynthesis protein B n=1 Tax=uncultured Cohaesibacter sp. TaxID=1002546 RepID=UPI0029C7B214|nr:molybdopterin-guanine dinucleotide biosynthesis protein B [uncultured Cohaesibacter sp.]
MGAFESFEWHGHKVFGVTGWKNSGKTTLVTRLISELTARGHRISSVKHAHHNCDIDKEGTDSFRHREAGSGEVALVAAGKRWAIMHECRDVEDTELGDILSRLSPCDLVLVEGFKTEPFPKIEVRRADAKHTDPIAPKDNMIVAVASDRPDLLADSAGLDCFDLNAVADMASLIEKLMGLKA